MPSTIRQYRPAFFTGFENATEEFNSLAELLEISWVKSFKFELCEKVNIVDPMFHQFSISITEERDDYPLMAEYNEGYSWVVVGFISNLELVRDLPVWKPKYKEVKQ